jgi:hypothetical protein
VVFSSIKLALAARETNANIYDKGMEHLGCGGDNLMRKLRMRRLVILGSLLTAVHFVMTWASGILVWTDWYPVAKTVFLAMLIPGRLFWEKMPYPRPDWVDWVLTLLNSSVWGWGISFVVEFLLAWRKRRMVSQTTNGSEDARV